MSGLKEIEARKRQVLRELEELERAKTECIREESGQAYQRIMALLDRYAEDMSEVQRGRLRAQLNSKPAAGRPDAPPPRYQLYPFGATWSGEGEMPAEFRKWMRSALGRAWRKDNPGQDFPPFYAL